MKSWNHIVEAMRIGNQKPYNQAYNLLIKKFRPKFTQKYHTVDADFDSIFNDKFTEILHRSINGTLTVKNEYVDGVLYRAIDNRYRETIRKSSTQKAQANPTFVELPPIEILNVTEKHAYSEKQYDEKDLQIRLMDQIIGELDETGQAITNGILANKKDKQIKEELNWTASNAAFSDKKKRTFKKFRKLYYTIKEDMKTPPLTN